MQLNLVSAKNLHVLLTPDEAPAAPADNKLRWNDKGLCPSLPHLLLPPNLRLLERAGPDAAFGRAGVALGGGVAPLAVARIVTRIARAHHCLAEIVSLGLAGRDVACGLIARRQPARHRPPADQRGEDTRRVAPAGVIRTVRVAALLAFFRRVDAEQADARAGHFQRVAIDDPGAPRDRRARLRRRGFRRRIERAPSLRGDRCDSSDGDPEEEMTRAHRPRLPDRRSS